MLLGVVECLMSLLLIDNWGFDVDQFIIMLDDVDGQLQLLLWGVCLMVFIGWKGELLIEKGIYIVDEIVYEGLLDRLIVLVRSVDFWDEFNVKCEVFWYDVIVECVVFVIVYWYGLKL